MVPGDFQVWKALFFFSSAQSLRDFSARLDDDKTKALMGAIEISSSVSLHLLSQVLDDGACFLKDASEGIDQTVKSPFRSPQF